LLLYPTGPLASAIARRPELKKEIFEFLNAISIETLLGEGRVYGGGLHKLEPKELMNVPADSLGDVTRLSALANRQMALKFPESATARPNRSRRKRQALQTL